MFLLISNGWFDDSVEGKELNMEKTLAVIEKIAVHNAALGAGLKAFARTLDVDRLLERTSDDAGS